MSRRVIVVGAGLAGLTAALRLARAGADVRLVSKGPGGLQLGQGTLDVLGYAPARVAEPLTALDALEAGHPYTLLGRDRVERAVAWLAGELPGLLVGDLTANVVLPTAVGALRPTCLYQPTMADAVGARSVAVVGVHQLKDLPAELVAGNLTRQGVPASLGMVDLPARRGEADPSATTYARALDDPSFARRFAEEVRARAGDGDVVALPAVLGLAPGTFEIIRDTVGRPVAEVLMPPPSVPGLRLYRALLTLCKAAGVRHVEGSPVVGVETSPGLVVLLSAAGGVRRLACDALVLAPGGFESGALTVDSHGRISERLLDLPLTATSTDGLVGPDHTDQALFAQGVRADRSMRPVDEAGGVVHPRLHVAGGILAGAQRWRELSGDGIAVATAVAAADAIMEEES